MKPERSHPCCCVVKGPRIFQWAPVSQCVSSTMRSKSEGTVKRTFENVYVAAVFAEVASRFITTVVAAAEETNVSCGTPRPSTMNVLSRDAMDDMLVREVLPTALVPVYSNAVASKLY